MKLKKNNCIFLCFFTLNLFFIDYGYSQSLQIPRDADTSRLRPPKLPLPSTPKFDLRIEAPEKAPVAKAVDEIDFLIKGIEIEGATYYPMDEIIIPFNKLIGKKISLDTLRQNVQKLEDKYRKDGFFLVRVIIPPQKVSDGIFKIKIIEGYINAAFAEGGSNSARKKIELIIKKLVNKRPIDLKSLERVLLLLNDIPGISGSGVLRQGSELGTSELVVTINPLPKVSYVSSLNNSSSKTMGLYGASINATINDPEFPSTVSLGFSTALKNDNDRLFNPILKAFNANYSTAIGNDGMIFSIGGIYANAEPQGSIKPLGILSKSYSVSPRFRYPIKRSRNESKYFEAGLTVGRSETFLLDTSTTKDKLTVADFVFSLTNDSWLGGSTQINFTLFHGLDLFGSRAESIKIPSPSISNFKQNFIKYKFSGNHTQLLKNLNAKIKFTLQAQWTNDKLLAGEQITFGGLSIGKGYDGGAVAGDKGFGLAVELSKIISKNPLPIFSKSNLEVYSFIDYAEARLLEEPISSFKAINSYLGSHGLGARLSDTSGMLIDLMVARARNEKPSSDARKNPRFIISLTKPF